MCTKVIASIATALPAWLARIAISISTVIGFIALPSLAVLTRLAMASSIDDLAKQLPWAQAVREGALRRLRPAHALHDSIHLYKSSGCV